MKFSKFKISATKVRETFVFLFATGVLFISSLAITVMIY